MDFLMPYRRPDDPRRVSWDFVKKLDQEDAPGTWLAQKKSDGWRRLAYRRRGTWAYYSKHDREAKSPPGDLVAEFESLPWPDNVAFDMEWVGPRCVDVLRGRHEFRVHDLLYMNGIWQGDVTFLRRHEALAKLFKGSERVSLTPVVGENLYKLFEEQKEDPLSEGIVIRRAGSGLIGDPRKVHDNPSWFKCKYRDIKEPTAF
jgi:hypothetical protein